MKTNKAVAKRLKVTKRGKIIGRKAGQNHFNAKEPRRVQLAKKRAAPVFLPPRVRRNLLAGL